MKNFIFLLVVLFGLNSCVESFHTGKANSKDKNGKKHGLWINYWDDAKTIPMTKKWFVHGREQWNTKTYHSNGELAVKFKDRGERIKVKYYDSTGKINHKGRAKFDNSEKETHYYWHGEWRFFNSHHQIIKKVMYKNGDVDSVLMENNKHHNQ